MPSVKQITDCSQVVLNFTLDKSVLATATERFSQMPIDNSAG
ncbi:hypothetical protein EG68_08098 [Paragonimus skrjabini miyazakii]|uniref:Uncharacterized protein n=1 Tax=Paragonimus skrjabini miyazakii TaxID=59628 RepID=A0A8S9YK48_9TREM|nr:hypothetical protein EG68_08098 [Paragonimus skrjabini miyazakii]